MSSSISERLGNLWPSRWTHGSPSAASPSPAGREDDDLEGALRDALKELGKVHTRLRQGLEA